MSINTITSPLSAHLLDSLVADHPNKIQLLISEIEEKKLLYKLLLIYEYGKGNLNNISLISDSLSFTTALKGYFKTGYDISEFSLCAAIDYTAQYDMRIDFEVNPAKAELLLSGEDIRERFDEI